MILQLFQQHIQQTIKHINYPTKNPSIDTLKQTNNPSNSRSIVSLKLAPMHRSSNVSSIAPSIVLSDAASSTQFDRPPYTYTIILTTYRNDPSIPCIINPTSLATHISSTGDPTYIATAIPTIIQPTIMSSIIATYTPKLDTLHLHIILHVILQLVQQ